MEILSPQAELIYAIRDSEKPLTRDEIISKSTSRFAPAIFDLLVSMHVIIPQPDGTFTLHQLYSNI